MFVWTNPPAGDGSTRRPTSRATTSRAIRGLRRPLDETGLTGDLELVDDGVPGDFRPRAATTLVGFTPGMVAVIDRGSCEFGVKVLNAEPTPGRSRAIVVNNQGDGDADDGTRCRR